MLWRLKNYHFEQDVTSCQAFAVVCLNGYCVVSMKFAFCVKTKSICSLFPFYTSVWGLRKSLLPEMRCCISRNKCSISSAAVTISQDDHTSFLDEKLLIFSWRIDMKDSIIILSLSFLMVLILISIKFYFFFIAVVSLQNYR